LLDFVTAVLVAYGVVVVDHAFVLLGEDLLQFCSCIGKKGGSGLLRLQAETRIVHRNPVFAEKLIGGFNLGDAAKPELLWQTSLPGSKYPLTAPPRLRRVGQNEFNTQLIQRPRDLRWLLTIHWPSSLRRPSHVTAAV